MSYEQFGRAFVETAVTEERVSRSLKEVAGDDLTIGPIKAGPADLAVVHAVGAVGDVVARRVPGERVAFVVEIPLRLEVDVNLAERHHRFSAVLTLPLLLSVRPEAPLRLVIDVVPPRSREVRVTVEPRGLQAMVVGKAGNIEAQICQHAARYVRERLADPLARQKMVIDLAPLVERAWT
jgi:hypothetical protein